MQGNCSEPPPDAGADAPWTPLQCQLVIDSTLFHLQAPSGLWLENLLIVTEQATQPVGGIVKVVSSIIMNEPAGMLYTTNVTLWGDAQASRGILMRGSSLYAEGAQSLCFCHSEGRRSSRSSGHARSTFDQAALVRSSFAQQRVECDAARLC